MLKLETGPISYHKPCIKLSYYTRNEKLTHFAEHMHSSSKWGEFWKSPLSVGSSGNRKGILGCQPVSQLLGGTECKTYPGRAAKFILHLGPRRKH